MVEVAVVILNWNGREDTSECLRSIREQASASRRLVVVDNGSSDGSVAELRRAFPDVACIENGRNLGYAGGNNVGIRHALEAGAEYVLVLNNDTVVEPGFLDRLLLAARQNPDAAVVGPYIFYLDRPDTLWFAGATWDEEALCFRWPGQDRTMAAAGPLREETAYVCGAAMMFRASVLREIGLFDERFFLVYEETDWCFRARRAGYRCLMVPQARIWHKVGASFGSEQSPLRAYFSARNELLWASLNLPVAQRQRMRQRALRRHAPHFGLGRSTLPWPKRFAWGAAQYARDWRRLLADTVQAASRAGLRDYFLGRFGDCPAQVRELAARWSEARAVGAAGAEV